MTILVTGASRGIGLDILRAFLLSDNLAYGCSRSGSTDFTADVTNEDDVREMVHSIDNLEAVINCAGIASMNHLLTTPIETARRIMEVNFIGTLLVSREAAKTGTLKRIVNVSSIAVPLGLEGEAVYASSKAAVEKLTEISAKELGGLGITVNTVGPAPVRTALIKSVPKEKIDALIDRQAIKRMCTWRDVYNVVKFFLSSESEFVTGQVIYLGGIS